jgi:two-component system sensor histidine kinase KdpD
MPESKPTSGGRLKLYLGYAAGVGKTYQMLVDAQDLAQSGSDVVIGYFEPHGRKDTIAKTQGLEFVPLRRVEYRGSVFGEMDTEAILRRNPKVCLVDELAHTNIPGSGRAKRWEDALVLVDHGIEVWTTMNVQHLESLNDQVWQMTRVRVRETLPDWVLKQADEVVMVDATPRALINRLLRGVVYAPEKARRALENFFQESNLAALRELALRETAHEVEVRHVMPELPELDRAAAVAPRGKRNDRILIHLTADSSAPFLIRRARRMADYLEADCFAVYVAPAEERLSPQRQAEIERILNFARNLHIETRVLQGSDEARTLIDFARVHRITQIFTARPRYSGWQFFSGSNLIHRVVREAPDIEIVIVAERYRDAATW